MEPWIYRLWDWADKNEIPAKVLPRTQHELRKLETLDLQEDGDYGWTLSHIPNEIGKLVNLTSLLFTIEIKTGSEIPREITSLKNLRLLSISTYGDDDVVVKLPDDIDRLTNIQKLFLNGNISSSSIKQLLKSSNRIITLHIKNNKNITTIPSNICPSAWLRSLHLIGNNSLILSREQVEWASQYLKNENQIEIRVTSICAVDGSSIIYGVKMNPNFQYYSNISFEQWEKWEASYPPRLPNPVIATQLLELEW